MSIVLGKNEEYLSAIETAQQRTGIDGSALAALIDAEAAKSKSGVWNKNSFNKGSHASGLTQFLENTWRGHALNPAHLLNEHCKKKGFVDGSNRIVSGKIKDVL